LPAASKQIHPLPAARLEVEHQHLERLAAAESVFGETNSLWSDTLGAIRTVTATIQTNDKKQILV
jgi:hypothetical protein